MIIMIIDRMIIMIIMIIIIIMLIISIIMREIHKNHITSYKNTENHIQTGRTSEIPVERLKFRFERSKFQSNFRNSGWTFEIQNSGKK